ncbi:hypothetical protein GGP41_008228 [Bipolaris sorokiniana]|uniref:Uncharacterized protein n=1 Tax=Cochliobolus sativus TaxID=45130 RepID=A0A8H5ZS37_COCSA|nr:hypothetical protein GGP41_008228 [Bipolaris sorokiniana]
MATKGAGGSVGTETRTMKLNESHARFVTGRLTQTRVQIRRPGFSHLTAFESRHLATSVEDGDHGQGEAIETGMEPGGKPVIRQRSQA